MLEHKKKMTIYTNETFKKILYTVIFALDIILYLKLG